jgi:hypothetical protein
MSAACFTISPDPSSLRTCRFCLHVESFINQHHCQDASDYLTLKIIRLSLSDVPRNIKALEGQRIWRLQDVLSISVH